MIELGDGSMGMLPEEWLKRYGMLADLGSAENGGLRFNASRLGAIGVSMVGMVASSRDRIGRLTAGFTSRSLIR